MSTRKLFRRTFDLGSIEQPELNSTGPLSQHPVPSLDERANIYLRAVCGSRDLAGEEFSRARLRILDAMAEQIALEVPAARPTPLPLGETSGRDAGTAITSYGYSESGAAYCGEDDTTDQSVDFENVSPVTRRDFSDEPEAARLMPLACVAQIDDREMYSLRTNVSDKRIPTSPHRGRRWGAKAIAACAFVALAGVAALVSHGGLSERWSATDQRVAVHPQTAENTKTNLVMEQPNAHSPRGARYVGRKVKRQASGTAGVARDQPAPRPEELMERGERIVWTGDILAARLVLVPAAEAWQRARRLGARGHL